MLGDNDRREKCAKSGSKRFAPNKSVSFSTEQSKHTSEKYNINFYLGESVLWQYGDPRNLPRQKLPHAIPANNRRLASQYFRSMESSYRALHEEQRTKEIEDLYFDAKEYSKLLFSIV